MQGIRGPFSLLLAHFHEVSQGEKWRRARKTVPLEPAPGSCRREPEDIGDGCCKKQEEEEKKKAAEVQEQIVVVTHEYCNIEYMFSS